MFHKIWTYKDKRISQDKRQEYSDKFNVPGFLIDLLYKKGIETEFEIDSFLNPSLDKLINPFLIKDMDLAVERILLASERGEQVTIYGDYDADGITSTAILFHFLVTYLELEVDFYLPDRLSEGYGLNIEAINYIASKGSSLIITVDCGIVSFDEVDYANEIGVDVIITDHHECGDMIPKAKAVINPMREDSEFPYRTLAGCGVAFKLLSALGYSIGLEEELSDYLPIVAIGTIGDSVPLTGENRIIVKEGLDRIKDGLWPGLVKLIELSNGNISDNFTSTYIAYNIVPKLNAAGRLGDASRGLFLLLSQDEEVALSYAKELIEENTKRQAIEQETTKEALLDSNIRTKDTDSVVIAIGKGWHQGVIGIVASKLVDRFNKPSLVLTYEEGSDTLVRGSARSIDGYNIHTALSMAQECLIKFGGHEMAAGLTMDIKDLDKLIEILNSYEGDQLTIAENEIDAFISHKDINLKNAYLLQCLEPYGVGNNQPLFAVTGIKISSCSKVGNDKHLRINLQKDNGEYVQGISFNKGSFCKMLNSVNDNTLFFRIGVNSYNNKDNVSVVIEDILDRNLTIEKSQEDMYNIEHTIRNNFTLSRDDMVNFYKVIQGLYKDGFAFADLFDIRKILDQEAFNWFKIRKALEVLIELELIIVRSKGHYRLNESQNKVELEKSKLFRSLNR